MNTYVFSKQKGIDMDVGQTKFRFTCNCGESTFYAKVATLSTGNMCFEWTCAGCQKDIEVQVPLKEIIEGIPPSPVQEQKEETKQLPAQSDKDFLHGLGIEGDME